nr:alpha-L-arabinofuranosidase [Clostridia bacterium]
MKLTVHPFEKKQAIDPLLYGVFFEDINYGGDGGLYAELVANRSFENVNHKGEDCRMMRWSPLPGGEISIRDESPRSGHNPHYLHVAGGVKNEGYLGQGFYAKQGESYRLTVIARAEQPCTLCAAFEAEGTVLACGEISLAADWHKQTLSIPMAQESRRVWLTLSADEAFDLDFVSLMPADTFLGRENGLRRDIAQAIADLHPAFLRFPGGCIVEGRSYENMYRFRETLGPVEDRRTNWNRWQMDEYQKEGRSSADYFQTYGLGFYEYFLYCEDIGAQPLPILNCGLTCQWHESLTIPMEEMGPIIQDYLDLIEFARGSESTPMGRIRAEMGHPAPFRLEMIGVGNEQWNDIYFERYEVIHAAVKAVYPDVRLVGCAGWTSSGTEYDAAHAWMRQTAAKPDYSDEHFYKRTSWYYENIDRYANYDPALPRVFVGEYAAHAEQDKGELQNSLRTAVAEAAFLTGVEQAAKNVSMTCYAPLLGRIGANQWLPDMIWFDEKGLFLTPNYHVQRMFSTNRGDWLGDITQAGSEELYTTVSFREDGTIILKAVNPTDHAVPADVALPGAICGKVAATVLTGCPEDVNSPDAPDRVCPVTREGRAEGGQLTWTFEPWSVSVLVIRAE